MPARDSHGQEHRHQHEHDRDQRGGNFGHRPLGGLERREYARLSTFRFDNGYADYREVLYAQNELFGAELSAVVSQVQAHTQIVNVYGAMGGGWVTDAAKQAPAPQGMAQALAP